MTHLYSGPMMAPATPPASTKLMATGSLGALTQSTTPKRKFWEWAIPTPTRTAPMQRSNID